MSRAVPQPPPNRPNAINHSQPLTKPPPPPPPPPDKHLPDMNINIPMPPCKPPLGSTPNFIEIANGVYVAAEVVTVVRTQPGEIKLGTSNGVWHCVDQDFCVSVAEKLGVDYTPPLRR